MNQAAIMGTAMLLMVGCHSAVTTSEPSTPTIQLVEFKEVTFYIAGMNARLKIL